MYEHECDSDEDCEVYFLKPVNEYNIVEKIKEANKELFGEADGDNVCGAGATGSVDEEDNACGNRKVTFAPNLEDYEPDSSTLEALKLTKEFEAAVAEVDELQRKLQADFHFPAIEEETCLEEITHTTLESTADVETTEIAKMPSSTTESSTNQQIEDDDVEEICEEIIIMDMESDKSTPETTRNRMVKQRTFDCADQDPVTAVVSDVPGQEPDNKSLTNLLTSDGEEECCSAATFDINVDNSDVELNDIEGDDNNADGDDEDDDDDLSIIVASYLPDDFDSRRLQRTPSSSGSSRTKSKSRLLAPFSKRFSFRRRAQSRNSIGTCCSSAARTNKQHMPPPEVTDLKFNYKICCEYRRQLAQPEKLPKYTGYLSEYGLSREQLQRREENLQRKKRYVLEQTLKTTEAEMRKMQDNERAFTTWLKNKMRYPINKTRNMFDVKRRNKNSGGMMSATCGGGSVVRNGSGRVK